MKCIYHLSALVSSKACKMLYRSVEDLIQYLLSGRAAKRSDQLVEIQEFSMGIEKKF